MYKQYLKVLPAKTGGNGVFTTVKILANSPVIEMTGDLFDSATAPHDNPALLQIGHNLFIGSSGSVDDYVNHSCEPNCLLHIVGNRAILYSMYDIMPDNEITFDYSTSSTDTLEQWKMKCQCNSPNCRKIISGFQYLSAELVDEYRKKKMIPLFLTEHIFRK